MRTNEKLHILSLEDSILDFEWIKQQLINAKFNFEITRVEKESEYTACLKEKKYDIILADNKLPQFDSFTALKIKKDCCPLVPFICVSGSISEETALELLKQGAVDYVLKDRPERLPFAIFRALNETKEKAIRQKAEEELFQLEENYRNSINESPLGIRIVNLDGKTIYANKAFLDIYDYCCLEEFYLTPSKARHTPESLKGHEERKRIRSVGSDVLEYEVSIIRKNKEIRQVKISRKELLWDGSKHFQVINQDITEQKKLTEELLVAKTRAEESDRLKSAFLANMSHEIRTPMNGILGFAELLKESDVTEEQRRSYVEIIEKSGHRLLNIINNIIDISKIESKEMELLLSETDIDEQMDFVYDFFMPEVSNKGLKLLIFKDKLLANHFVRTDKDKFVAILINLIKNAIKFTPSGIIQIGYQVKHVGLLNVGDLFEQTVLEFFVKDTGVGISPDQMAFIFDRFRQGSEKLTRNYEGAGLGLSISKAYVEMLGGKIWVESEENRGSTFFFTLPLKMN